VKKWFLWIEMALLYILAPLVVGLTIHRVPWLLVLGGITIFAARWLFLRGNFSFSNFWHCEDKDVEQLQFKQVILRFLICALLVVGLTTAFYPEKLFALPWKMPIEGGLLLVSYAIFSVYPQELLYRAFFLKRYQELFPNGQGLWLANTLVFAWLHVIYRNPLAIAFTLVGGWFFTQTYARTRSMRLVCFEHTLYGGLIFCVGLGEFFLQNKLFQ
jgi:membrane protease YdiL (CAAX protease family)